MLNSLETRVMVPLVRVQEFGRRPARLHPVFTICGGELVMATHLLAAIRFIGLGRAVESISGQMKLHRISGYRDLGGKEEAAT